MSLDIKTEIPKAFTTSQGPFITDEFCAMLGYFTKVTKIGDAPVIFGHKTFYWADTVYPNVKAQFIMGKPEHTSPFFYFIQKPGTIAERRTRYNKRFREYAQTAMVNLDVSIEKVTDKELTQKLYALYIETIERLGSVAFPYVFFEKILGLSYAFAIIARKDGEPCACGIMLGNSLFIQASNALGYEESANYAVYDAMYSLYEDDYIFTGVTIREGHTSFKYRSGATPYHVGTLDKTWYAPYTENRLFMQCYEFFLRNLASEKLRAVLLLPY